MSFRLGGRIVVLLASILFLSMLLTSIVYTLLWYNLQLTKIIEQINTSISIVPTHISLQDNGFVENSFNEISLQALEKLIGKPCRKVVLINSGEVTAMVGKDEKIDSRFIQLLTSSTFAERMLTRHIDRGAFSAIPVPDLLAIAVPLRGKGRTVLGIIVDPLQIVMEIWHNQKIVWLYIFVNIIIFTLVGYFRLQRSVLRPIRKLADIAGNYKYTTGGLYFDVYSGDEFGQLAGAMNQMLRRIEDDRGKLQQSLQSLKQVNRELQESQQEALQAERLAASGRLASGLAHEIGNPAAIVQGYLELLEKDNLAAEERKQFCRRAMEEMKRIDKLLRQLLDGTRLKAGNIEKVEIKELVKETGASFGVAASRRGIRMETVLCDEQVVLSCDREALRQVIFNCLVNAMDAITEQYGERPGGIITTTLSVLEIDGEKMAQIIVEDDGTGLPAGQGDVIFEPFFTTKPPGKGTGLGLAHAYRFVSAMGGRIEAEQRQGGGARFCIILPLASGG